MSVVDSMLKTGIRSISITSKRLKSSSASSLIPPSVSSLREIGKLSSKFPQAHPEIFSSMKNLYKNLPKGNAVKKNPNGFYEWYYEKYVESNSTAPILHFFAVLIPLGYYLTYVKGGHYHTRYEFH